MMDLRVPSGLFFTLLGLLLLGMAIFAPDTRAELSDANVNLYCGLAMLIFGVSTTGSPRMAGDNVISLPSRSITREPPAGAAVTARLWLGH